ncbi:MAG: beta-lactamase family protein [Chitinophagaceae bacterium]|nr:beta-lactamase family protein [Chitinophagaceae bacterium]
MRINTAIFLGVFFVFTSSAARTRQQEIQNIADKPDLPAVQTVYAKNGRLSSFIAGKKKAGSAKNITGHTIFQAASLTKVVTAYAFLKLYDKGLITPDKPLYEHYAYSAGTKNEQRHLLFHDCSFPPPDGKI